MEISIDFQDTLERCKLESAFIGRTAQQQVNDEMRITTDDDIFSRHYVGKFNMIRIRGSDDPLVMTFIREGAHKLEMACKWAMTTDGQYTQNTLVWYFQDNTKTNQDNTKNHQANTLIQDNTATNQVTLETNQDNPEYIQDYSESNHATLKTNQDNTLIQDNTATNQDNYISWMVGIIEDLLSAYALYRWLYDKLPDQSSIFLQHYENTLTAFSTQLATAIMKKPMKRKVT